VFLHNRNENLGRQFQVRGVEAAQQRGGGFNQPIHFFQQLFIRKWRSAYLYTQFVHLLSDGIFTLQRVKYDPLTR